MFSRLAHQHDKCDDLIKSPSASLELIPGVVGLDIQRGKTQKDSTSPSAPKSDTHTHDRLITAAGKTGGCSARPPVSVGCPGQNVLISTWTA